MFIQNKYYKWYFNIINHRKANPGDNVYLEKHHIIPKSMGGDNTKINLISLTAKEHFICHMLLFRMTLGKDKVKMAYALRLMSNMKNQYQGRYKLSSRKYALIVEKTKALTIQSAEIDRTQKLLDLEKSRTSELIAWTTRLLEFGATPEILRERDAIIARIEKLGIRKGDEVSIGFVFIGSEKHGRTYNNLFINQIDYVN